MPGTIYANDDLDAGDIAQQLRDAMQGFGTNEELIINILVSFSNDQRQEIATAFKASFGTDLIDELKSELGGDFESAVVAMMTPVRQFEARELNRAICGVGTDETPLIEILCSRTNEGLQEIKEQYKEEFESELEEDLQCDTSGYFGRLLVALCANGREPEENWADEDKAQEDAQKLYEAGAANYGTEEADINAVLCLRSFGQLQATFRHYKALTEEETDIEDAIYNETSADLKDGFLAVVRASKNLQSFFARRIKAAVAGIGTEDMDLIRLLVCRSENDLQEIKEAYQNLYEGETISDAIENECSGDYKRLLLAIVNRS